MTRSELDQVIRTQITRCVSNALQSGVPSSGILNRAAEEILRAADAYGAGLAGRNRLDGDGPRGSRPGGKRWSRLGTLRGNRPGPPHQEDAMNVLSLFSGIGGLDLGLERAGMTVVGQVEIDPWCRKVLAKHWPEVPRHDDVRTCAEWWGDRAAPDVVAGGFPCQPVSLAGKGLAQADSRWLWPATRDVIRDLRPRWVLLENVPGLLGRGMGDVLGDLAAIGYDAEWDCVPAAFVGAPHIRNRVWIVAYPQHDGLPTSPLAGTGQGPQPGQWCQRWAVPQSAGSGGSPGDVADAGSERRHWRQNLRRSRRHKTIWQQTGSHSSDSGSPRRRSDWWITEPDVGRVAHGIPRRVDRLRGLGNAVVPQVAEHIGRLIMNAAGAA